MDIIIDQLEDKLNHYKMFVSFLQHYNLLEKVWFSFTSIWIQSIYIFSWTGLWNYIIITLELLFWQSLVESCIWCWFPPNGSLIILCLWFLKRLKLSVRNTLVALIILTINTWPILITYSMKFVLFIKQINLIFYHNTTFLFL